MTSTEIGRSLVRQARLIVAEAERHARGGAWHLAVRRAQEVVELSLKGLLRIAGVEVPRVHDVGVLVGEHAPRLGPEVGEHLDRLVSVSRRLRAERELSLYGDPTLDTPPDRLYTRVDGEAAVQDARFVLDLVERQLPE